MNAIGTRLRDVINSNVIGTDPMAVDGIYRHRYRGKRNPLSKHLVHPVSDVVMWRMRGMTRDGTTELVSRDQILRRERGHGNFIFPAQAVEGVPLLCLTYGRWAPTCY